MPNLKLKESIHKSPRKQLPARSGERKQQYKVLSELDLLKPVSTSFVGKSVLFKRDLASVPSTRFMCLINNKGDSHYTCACGDNGRQNIGSSNSLHSSDGSIRRLATRLCSRLQSQRTYAVGVITMDDVVVDLGVMQAQMLDATALAATDNELKARDWTLVVLMEVANVVTWGARLSKTCRWPVGVVVAWGARLSKICRQSVSYYKVGKCRLTSVTVTTRTTVVVDL